MKLKVKITQITENHRIETMKLNKLNNEIAKFKIPIKKSEITNPRTKTKEDFEASKAGMRNENRLLEEKIEKLKEQIKEKSEKVFFLLKN